MSVVQKRHDSWPGRQSTLEADESASPDTRRIWRALAQAAIILMAALMLGAFLYVARPLLLPVLSAVVVGMTLGPYLGFLTRRGVPAFLLALLVVLTLIAAANLAIVMLAGPITEMLRLLPEIAQAIKDKLHFFDRPLLAFYQLQIAFGSGDPKAGIELNMARLFEGIVTIVTPAAVQFLLQFILFIGTLFFFILGRSSFRSHAVNWFASRGNRLRTLKILNDVEGDLSRYLLVVTAINLCLGLVTAIVSYFMGLPYPLLWGALAFALNYVPYVGPSIMYVLLFLVGLLTYPTLLGGLVPPAVFMGITLIEGQFITPAIVGRQVLQLHPLTIFLGIAFWAWLWGPLGAFLATPILIVVRVAFDHLYPRQTAELPG